MKKITFQNNLLIIFCMLISGIYVVLCSFSTSLLYPNYYGGDSAQFLTVGRAWYSGSLPYVDIFDHKGPIIFFVDMIGYLIGNGTTYGILLIQILSLFITLLAILRICRLTTDSIFYEYMVIICSLLIMKINYVDGNSVEEYCLPFISWSLYGILLYLENNCDSYNEHNSKWSIVYGLTIGVCLLTRATNAVPLIGGLLFIIVELIRKHKIANVFKNIVFGVIGFGIVVLPFTVYFYSKGALSDYWYGMVTYNIAYSHKLKSWLLSGDIKEYIKFAESYFLFFSIWIAAILNALMKDKRKAICFCLIAISETALFLSGERFLQYPLVCLPQLAICIGAILKFPVDSKIRQFIKMAGMLILVLFLIAGTLHTVKSVIRYRSASADQDRWEWMKLVDMVPVKDRDSFVAYGGNDLKEIYLIEDIVPCYKYFVIQEWHASFSNNVRDEIYDIFNNGDAKWILTDDATFIIKDCLEERYKLIAQNNKYSLYNLIEQNA